MTDTIERSDEDLAKIQEELGVNAGDGKESSASEGEYIPGADDAASGPMPNGNEEMAIAVGMMVQIGTTFLAARLGPHWEATEEEAGAMGKAYADAIDHYFPDTEMGPGTAAVLVTGMYALPRLAIQKAKAKEAEEKAEQEEFARGDQS